jgi:nucleotide-binding universal stress UspA family protein
MIQIKRILCPTDFSDFARHAFDHAVALARCYDATVTLLHVAHCVPVTAPVYGGVGVPAVALSFPPCRKQSGPPAEFVVPDRNGSGRHSSSDVRTERRLTSGETPSRRGTSSSPFPW